LTGCHGSDLVQGYVAARRQQVTDTAERRSGDESMATALTYLRRLDWLQTDDPERPRHIAALEVVKRLIVQL
jgi:hypothetical protein